MTAKPKVQIVLVLVKGLSKADVERRIQVQAVSLRGNPRKRGKLESEAGKGYASKEGVKGGWGLLWRTGVHMSVGTHERL